MEMHKIRIGILAASFIIGILLGYLSYFGNSSTLIISSDFTSFYTGAKIVKEHGIKELYNAELQNQIQKEMFKDMDREILGKDISELETRAYRNPPILAFVLEPLANFSKETAYTILVSIVALTLLTSLLVLYKFDTKNLVPIYILAFYIPSLNTLINTQSSVVVFLCFLLWFLHFEKTKEVKPGLWAMVVIALSLKPHLLLILLPLLAALNLNKKVLVTTVITGILILSVNLALYGRTFIPTYTNFLINTENDTHGTDLKENFSLVGIFASEKYYQFTWLGCGIGLVGLSLYLLFNRKLETNSKIALAISWGLFFMPHLMAADFLLSIISLAIVSRKAPDNKVSYLVPAIFYFLPILGVFQYGWIASLGTALLIAISIRNREIKQSHATFHPIVE